MEKESSQQKKRCYERYSQRSAAQDEQLASSNENSEEPPSKKMLTDIEIQADMQSENKEVHQIEYLQAQLTAKETEIIQLNQQNANKNISALHYINLKADGLVLATGCPGIEE